MNVEDMSWRKNAYGDMIDKFTGTIETITFLVQFIVEKKCFHH